MPVKVAMKNAACGRIATLGSCKRDLKQVWIRYHAAKCIEVCDPAGSEPADSAAKCAPLTCIPTGA